MVKTVIEIDENNVDYYRETKSRIRFKKIEVIIFIIVIFVIGFLFSLIQYFNYTPYIKLQDFKRIKNNMLKWKTSVIEKTNIESKRGKRVALSLNNSNIYDFNCYNFDSYYAALRLNSSSYLPEFIRRGSGDVWKVTKAAEKDPSAKQYCDYLIKYKSTSYITCGLSMFNELSYSGFFNENHPCKEALNILVKQINKI